jgi:hypothetical protein
MAASKSRSRWGSIYLITFLPDGRQYVGSSWNLEKRRSYHMAGFNRIPSWMTVLSPLLRQESYEWEGAPMATEAFGAMHAIRAESEFSVLCHRRFESLEERLSMEQDKIDFYQPGLNVKRAWLSRHQYLEEFVGSLPPVDMSGALAELDRFLDEIGCPVQDWTVPDGQPLAAPMASYTTAAGAALALGLPISPPALAPAP